MSASVNPDLEDFLDSVDDRENEDEGGKNAGSDEQGDEAGDEKEELVVSREVGK